MPRPRYVDLEPGDFSPEAMAPWAAVELKLDGLFARFIGDANGWSITGRNGAMLRWGDQPYPDCYLQGEQIEGTEWAANSALYGKFAPWRCVYRVAVAPSSYQEQRAMLPYQNKERDQHFALTSPGQSWPVADAEAMWKRYVLKEGYEGLIFRSADGQRYGRMKRVVTMDYVCMGFKTEGPRFTAVQGGLYIDGRLDHVCTVPIKSPVEQAALYSAYLKGAPLSPVFEAKGNAVLKSGALRHPRQAGEGGAVKWRADKAARECVL